MSKQDEKGACSVKTVLDLATETATAELGTDAANKRVSATAKLTKSVTEAGKTNTSSYDAGVTLGVSTQETDAPADCCCAAQGGAGCCCKKQS